MVEKYIIKIRFEGSSDLPRISCANHKIDVVV
jgi:hypothetical protein